MIASTDYMSPLIRPLERLTLPTDLDGSTSRAASLTSAPLIDAKSDLEAIGMWLAEVAQTAACFRSYRLEAERCLLWATVERCKPLSALTDADMCEYGRFLSDPRPRERWVNANLCRRTDDCWRPFRATLSPQSCARALRIVTLLFGWLHSTGYISRNPRRRTAQTTVLTERGVSAIIDVEPPANVATTIEWSYLRKALDLIDERTEEEAPTRARLVLYLAYYADLKPGEICDLRPSAISLLVTDQFPVWKIAIEERPARLREIVLLPPVQQVLEQYLERLDWNRGEGMTRLDTPLIASSRSSPNELDGSANLSDHSLRVLTREVFSRAAILASLAGDTLAARRLSAASVNWLRHAFEVAAANHNMRKNWTWQLLGACWLASYVTRAYLPDRELSSTCVSDAFNDLRDLVT